MLPTVDNAHVAEGVALFTDYLRKQTVIPALTATYLRKVQELETALWGVINSRMLANSPTGDVLTKLGALVGQPRGSLNDVNLLQAVKLRILANKSSGLAEDAITLASAISSVWNYLDAPAPSASFLVEVYDIPSPDMAQSLLSAARPAGVYGVMNYSTWPDGGDFEFGSVYDATAGQLGYGSVYSASTGGLLVSSRRL